MTPEELKRAIEFLIEHQAQFAAKMESTHDRWEVSFAQEREERVKDLPRLARVEAAFVKLGELVEMESRRLDSHEQEFYALLRQGDEDRRQAQQRHVETLADLKEILARLTNKN